MYSPLCEVGFVATDLTRGSQFPSSEGDFI